MTYQDRIVEVKAQLISEIENSDNPRAVLRSSSLRELYSQIKTIDISERKAFGQAVNQLKQDLETKIAEIENAKLTAELPAIDVTAPFDSNTAKKPKLLRAENGSIHPINQELSRVLDIFGRMGFSAMDSRQLDDEYHMFTSLNFPDNHPARDEYDTFITTDGLVAPAHTSVMQTRILRTKKDELEKGNPIAYVIPGRVFRNEDVDARHEHTFHQVEGIYVGKDVTVGDLIGTFKTFLETYYGKKLDIRFNPFYFPFTEPSFELTLSCPFCMTLNSQLPSQPQTLQQQQSDGFSSLNDVRDIASIRENNHLTTADDSENEKQAQTERTGCKVCGYEGWIELLGMGMIHPNVLKEAGVDPEEYTGFAWGVGLDRLVMMKNNIEDVRHFHSGNLSFLKQFGARR